MVARQLGAGVPGQRPARRRCLAQRARRGRFPELRGGGVGGRAVAGGAARRPSRAGARPGRRAERDRRAGRADRGTGRSDRGGCGRVMAHGLPGLACRIIDLPESFAAEEAGLCRGRELAAPDDETEVAWTPLGRHGLRLRRGVPAPTSAPVEAIRLTMTQPGLLHTLRWTADTRRVPEAGQIAVDVRASGLNFRDVMWAMGLLPEEALLDGFAGPTLGLECSGVV